jgi:large subunit ribosomal protein L24
MQTTKPIKDPRKQRKRLYNAPAHLRHKIMAAPLSPGLTSSKGVKTLPVRKGDTVRVVRGDHIGFEGKVSRVDLKNYRIFLEGLTREKVDGTNIFVSLHPSKVMIKNLKLDDKWRKAIVERKKELATPKKEKKVKKKATKPTAETIKIAEEKVAEEKPVKKASSTSAKKTTQKKKPATKKKKKEKPVAKAKQKTAKKAPAKRKAASKTKGGT